MHGKPNYLFLYEIHQWTEMDYHFSEKGERISAQSLNSFVESKEVIRMVVVS